VLHRTRRWSFCRPPACREIRAEGDDARDDREHHIAHSRLSGVCECLREHVPTLGRSRPGPIPFLSRKRKCPPKRALQGESSSTPGRGFAGGRRKTVRYHALTRRSGRVAEGGALLRRYVGECLHRGFESLLLRSEGWQSGRMRRSRKPLSVVRRIEGSNPSPSAKASRSRYHHAGYRACPIPKVRSAWARLNPLESGGDCRATVAFRPSRRPAGEVLSSSPTSAPRPPNSARTPQARASDPSSCAT
jgi:hypothetical protein